MIIQPKVWGFVCAAAHPVGCALNVRDQVESVRRHDRRGDGPRRALIIGASTGYGLAARLVAAFGCGAATLGVFQEKPAKAARTATAGWYNAAAFDRAAGAAGLQSLNINGDAFASATRASAVEMIRTQMDGPIDLIVYSLAAPARRLADGTLIHTALKPIGAAFSSTTIDTDRDRLVPLTVAPADAAEIRNTTTVMGGEGWTLWIDALAEAGLLAPGAKTVAFSYVGPELTWPIYRHGTIGRAKADLEATAAQLRARGIDARVAIMKFIVSQASAAIPVIPLYASLVLRVMRETGIDENAIEQQQRLFADFLYRNDGRPATADADGHWRLDDRELRADVQRTCAALWEQVNDDNLRAITDYNRYKREFLRLFGFARDDVDYTADVAPVVDFDCVRM